MLTLVGCGSGAEEEPGNNEQDSNVSTIKEAHVKLQDGRDVTCLTFKRGYGGGMSCDWANAK